MTLPVSPDIDTVMTKLRALLLDILPATIEVIQGPVNRAAQPKGGHVVITHLYDMRLRTNETTYTRPTDPAPAAGTADIEQGTEIHVQLDFYGGTNFPASAPAQWAIAASTIFRDEYAVAALAPEAAPLYIDDARMIPLVTGEEQYRVRYACTAHIQYNPVTTKPQQFADELVISTIDANILE
jgi:hypothetical protein